MGDTIETTSVDAHEIGNHHGQQQAASPIATKQEEEQPQ